MATHQIHFLATANQIVYLQGGKMKFKGSFSELNSSEKINLNDLLMNNSSLISLTVDDASLNETMQKSLAESEAIPLIARKKSTSRSLKSTNKVTYVNSRDDLTSVHVSTQSLVNLYNIVKKH